MNHNPTIRWLRVLCVGLSLMLTMLLTLTAGAQQLLDSLPSVDATVPSPEPQPSKAPEVHLPVSSDQTVTGANSWNILLIGQDRREQESRQRSDAMILCSIRKDNGTVTLISFLRDTYLPIPGHRENRLNAAFQWGGMPLLRQTLETNFEVAIDGCLAVDFDGFQTIIDRLGGVTIPLTAAEASYMNAHCGWTLCEGEAHLTGEQALFYSRIRAIGSDFARTQRQRQVLTALLARVKTADMTTLLSFLRQLLPLVSTDMSSSQLLRTALAALPTLRSASIRTAQIPGAGTYRDAVIDNMSVLVPDMDANRALIQQLLEGN